MVEILGIEISQESLVILVSGLFGLLGSMVGVIQARYKVAQVRTQSDAQLAQVKTEAKAELERKASELQEEQQDALLGMQSWMTEQLEQSNRQTQALMDTNQVLAQQLAAEQARSEQLDSSNMQWREKHDLMFHHAMEQIKLAERERVQRVNLQGRNEELSFRNEFLEGLLLVKVRERDEDHQAGSEGAEEAD